MEWASGYTDYLVRFAGSELKLRGHSHKDVISVSHWANGSFYELGTLKHLFDHHRVQGVVVDVGANIGNHSAFFSHFLDSHAVHSIEPCLETCGLLAHNMRQFPDSVVHCAACGKEEGVAVVRKSDILPDEPSCNVVDDVSYAGDKLLCATTVITVDNLGLDAVSLLKVDAEGMEFDVLLGAVDTIRNSFPLLIVELDDQDEYDKVSEWLRSDFDYVPKQWWDYGGRTVEFMPECKRHHCPVDTNNGARSIDDLSVKHSRVGLR